MVYYGLRYKFYILGKNILHIMVYYGLLWIYIMIHHGLRYKFMY